MSVSSLTLNDLSLRLEQTLALALADAAGKRRAVMFSGGFDSMLIARLAQKLGAAVTAVTVQFDDFNPLTVAGAREFAEKAGIKHHVLDVKPVEFLSAFEELSGLIEDPTADFDLGVVYAALKKYDPKKAGNVFLSGMGCDQWFGNEALLLGSRAIEARVEQTRMEKQIHQQVAQAHGCEFIFPFLSEAMLALSQTIPAAMKKDKKLLRTLASARAIPHRAFKSEVQVPAFMRRMVMKTYGYSKHVL